MAGSHNGSFLFSLRVIREKAANLRKLTEQSLALQGGVSKSRYHTPSDPIPNLDLPLPSQVFNDLDFSSSLVVDLTSRVHNWITKIHGLYQQRFENACRQLIVPQSRNNYLSMDKIESLRQLFRCTYLNNDLPRINQRISLLRSQLIRRCGIDKKSSFKNEHRPMLEKYFRFNAYPSVQERCTLAQKTNMTTRQIEVWFQNHRNRSKKSGISLSRRDGPPFDFESWDSSESSSLEAESDDESFDTPVHSPSDTISQICPFSSSSPPHAFPNKYSPDCSMDPFSNCGVFTFPPISWPRKPVESSSIPPPSLTATAIDELSQMFACKLNFRENISKAYPTKNKRKQSPWYHGITTVPCSAPLPSLIRKTPTMRTLRTNTSLHHPLFGAPSVISNPKPYMNGPPKPGDVSKRWPAFTISRGPSSTPPSPCLRIPSTSSVSSLELVTPVSSRPSSPVIRAFEHGSEYQDPVFEPINLFNDFPFDAVLSNNYDTLPPSDFSKFAFEITAHS